MNTTLSNEVQDVKKFYTDFYGANNSISAFVGETDKKLVTDFLQKTFGTWNSKASFTAIKPQYFEIKGETALINTPDKTNAMMLGNINLNISEKNPDFPAVFMANELLGGGAFLSSRIPQRLRENEGMSYGAGTYLNSNYQYEAGNWGVYATFNPLYKGRLDSAMHQEIDKAISGGFTKDELERSKTSMMEQDRTSLGNNGYLANLLRWYIRDDRNLDDFTQFQNKLKALNVETVNASLRKYFDKTKFVLVYGGEFEKGKAPEKTEKNGLTLPCVKKTGNCL